MENYWNVVVKILFGMSEIKNVIPGIVMIRGFFFFIIVFWPSLFFSLYLGVQRKISAWMTFRSHVGPCCSVSKGSLALVTGVSFSPFDWLFVPSIFDFRTGSVLSLSAEHRETDLRLCDQWIGNFEVTDFYRFYFDSGKEVQGEMRPVRLSIWAAFQTDKPNFCTRV